MGNGGQRRWLQLLSDEDLSFIKRFVLSSGSLKQIAKSYGISYPTVRIRLDRLIAKIEVIDSMEIQSEFERALRAKYAEGKIDMETLKDLLNLHRAEIREVGDSSEA